MCEICDVIFPSQDLLDQHLQIHAAMKKMLEKNTSGGEVKEETDELSSINLVKGASNDYIDNDDDDDESEAMPSLEVKDGSRKRVTKEKAGNPKKNKSDVSIMPRKGLRRHVKKKTSE